MEPGILLAARGPIIFREKIAYRFSKGIWYAMLSSDLGDGERAPWTKMTWVVRDGTSASAPGKRQQRFDGPNPLCAALRCFVASRLGEEVELPDFLAVPC